MTPIEATGQGLFIAQQDGGKGNITPTPFPSQAKTRPPSRGFVLASLKASTYQVGKLGWEREKVRLGFSLAPASVGKARLGVPESGG